VPEVGNNLVDLVSAFTDPGLGGFDASHCVVAPPRAGVAEIGRMFIQAAADAEDLLLFYFAGHGLLSRPRHDLYLGVAETSFGQPAFSALPFDAIRDACLESRAANRVVILDCCFSGRAIEPTLAGADEVVMSQVEVAGTYTLTAAPRDKAALIRAGESNTAFTGRMLQLMRSGIPGAGQFLSLGEIYRRLHLQLRAEGLPAPQQRGTETADLIGLVRNVFTPPPPPPPPPAPRPQPRRMPVPTPRAAAPTASEHRLAERELEARRVGDAGNPADAARLFQRIVIDRERLNGTEGLATLIARSQMAYYVGEARDHSGAISMFEELVTDMTSALGADHPQTLIARSHMAFYTGLDNHREEAVKQFERLVGDMTRALGADHEETLVTRRHLATYVGLDGDYGKAVRMLRKLVGDMTEALGAYHEQTLISQQQMMQFERKRR
jgi:hypothetical protein